MLLLRPLLLWLVLLSLASPWHPSFPLPEQIPLPARGGGNKVKEKMHLQSKVRTSLSTGKYLPCMSRKTSWLEKLSTKTTQTSKTHTKKEKNWSTVIAVSKWELILDQEHINVLNNWKGKRFHCLTSFILFAHWRDQSWPGAALRLHWAYLVFFLINVHFRQQGWCISL